MTLRVGVVGVGAMGRIHAEHLAARVRGATLVAVADTNADIGEAVAKSLGVPLLSGIEDLLASDIDAVVISSPRTTHVPFIVGAAKTGKHVFSEKPIASSVAEADEALTAVERAGVMLQIGFHRRFDRNFHRVHEVIADGAIGDVRMVHIVSRDPMPAATLVDRAPEDLILETTIHDFDVARHLTGSEIESVFAVGIPAGGGPVEGAVLTLRMADGVIVTIDNHLMSAVGYDQRVDVFGTRGEVAIANETPHLATLSDATGVTRARPLFFFAERYADAYAAELESFVQAVANKATPRVTGADGRAAVVAAEAALESLRTGLPVQVRG